MIEYEVVVFLKITGKHSFYVVSGRAWMKELFKGKELEGKNWESTRTKKKFNLKVRMQDKKTTLVNKILY